MPRVTPLSHDTPTARPLAAFVASAIAAAALTVAIQAALDRRPVTGRGPEAESGMVHSPEQHPVQVPSPAEIRARALASPVVRTPDQRLVHAIGITSSGDNTPALNATTVSPFEDATRLGNAALLYRLAPQYWLDADRAAAETALQDGRTDEARRLMTAFIAAEQARENRVIGSIGAATAEALAALAWVEIVAHRFDEAMALCERAHRLAPSLAKPELYRAYALALAGHEDEAQAIHAAHRDDRVRGRAWPIATATDRDALKSLGLTLP